MKRNSSFTTTNLGSVAQIQTGPFGSQLHERDYVEIGTPIITVEHLGYAGIIKNNIPCVSESDTLRLKKYLLKTGDIVFSRVGSVDRCVIIGKDEHNWLFSGRCLRVRTSSESIIPEYLYYFFSQKSFKQYVRNNAVGATMPSLNSSILRRLRIKYPAFSKQKNTIEILQSIEESLSNNRRRIELLEESARLLYREWFVYFRFPGHEHHKIIDGVPEGWRRVHLEDFVSTQYGFTETATQEEIGPKFLRGTDINKNSFINWSSVPYCTEQGLNFEKYALNKDDIVIIRMADPGKVAIIEKEIKAIFASYLVRIKIRPGAPLFPYFLFYILKDDLYQGFISNASTGSTRQSASAKLLVNFRFNLPPLILQESFNEQITPIRNQLNTLLDQNSTLAQARDLLLPRLMSGEIEVQDASN